MSFKSSVAAANRQQNTDTIPRKRIDPEETLEALAKLARTVPRPSSQWNNQRSRKSRPLAGVVILALIGVVAAVGWRYLGTPQSSAAAKPALASEVAVAVPPTADKSVSDVVVSAAQAAQETLVPPSAAPQPVDAQQLDAIARELAALRQKLEQLDATARDVAGLRQTVDQLTAGQEQMARDIAERQAAEQDNSRKIAESTPAPESRRATAARAHKPTPTSRSAKQPPAPENSDNLFTRVLQPFQSDNK